MAYSADQPRGNVVDVAMNNGQILAAAEHYGALYYALEDGHWNSRPYPEKVYTFAVNRVL